MLQIKLLFFITFNSLRKFGLNILIVSLLAFLFYSCSDTETEVENETPFEENELVEIPKRPGDRPETTLEVPHLQLGVELVPEVHEELIRRVYSIPGIEHYSSVLSQWKSLSLAEGTTLLRPEALIEDREFGHIHDDGSLHIFLSPSRSETAVDSCWAVHHPFSLREQEEGTQVEPGGSIKTWQGFVMLYTPQSIDELNVTFQLIIDAYNNVTGESLVATDFY